MPGRWMQRVPLQALENKSPVRMSQRRKHLFQNQHLQTMGLSLVLREVSCHTPAAVSDGANLYLVVRGLNNGTYFSFLSDRAGLLGVPWEG
jgi:hypothetical protein